MRAGPLVIKYQGKSYVRLVPSLLSESQVRKYRDWFAKVHEIKVKQRKGNR